MVRLNWDDPTKQLPRNLEQLSILDLFANGDHTNLQVLHLPGASDLEYQRVFKPAGISPSGIVGVEREPEVFKILESKKQRGEIQYELYYGTFEEYIATTRRKFDVISADTTENFGADQADMVWNIFQRPVLQDRGVLQTVFVAQRDKKLQRIIYLAWALSETLMINGTLDGKINAALRKFSNASKPEMSLKSMRDIGITEFITYCAKMGRHISPKFSKSVHELEKYFERRFPVRQFGKIWGNELAEKLMYNLCCSSYNLSLTQNLHKHGVPSNLISYFMLEQRKPWFLKKINKYMYIGEGGTSMYGDILELDRRNDLFAKRKNQICIENFLTAKRSGSKVFPKEILSANLNYAQRTLKEIKSYEVSHSTPRITLSVS